MYLSVIFCLIEKCGIKLNQTVEDIRLEEIMVQDIPRYLHSIPEVLRKQLIELDDMVEDFSLLSEASPDDRVLTYRIEHV